jgi:hypothetical protein
MGIVKMGAMMGGSMQRNTPNNKSKVLMELLQLLV